VGGDCGRLFTHPQEKDIYTPIGADENSQPFLTQQHSFRSLHNSDRFERQLKMTVASQHAEPTITQIGLTEEERISGVPKPATIEKALEALHLDG
jgi:hypothetical protein